MEGLYPDIVTLRVIYVELDSLTIPLLEKSSTMIRWFQKENNYERPSLPLHASSFKCYPVRWRTLFSCGEGLSRSGRIRCQVRKSPYHLQHNNNVSIVGCTGTGWYAGNTQNARSAGAFKGTMVPPADLAFWALPARSPLSLQASMSTMIFPRMDGRLQSPLFSTGRSKNLPNVCMDHRSWLRITMQDGNLVMPHGLRMVRIVPIRTKSDYENNKIHT